MSDLDNAINSINASAAKAENTATFLDDMSTFDDQSSVTNPNNGQTVASIPKQVKDRTDELFASAESDINQAVADAEQSATDAQDAADSIGRYQGLWPDTGGSANKGETWQTQIGGTPTGLYFAALQNTTVDPVGDNVNWRSVVSDKSLGDISRYNSKTLADAISYEALKAGDTISVNERESGNGGGASWVAISGVSTVNGIDIVQHDTLDISLVLLDETGEIDKYGALKGSDVTAIVQRVSDLIGIVSFPSNTKANPYLIDSISTNVATSFIPKSGKSFIKMSSPSVAHTAMVTIANDECYWDWGLKIDGNLTSRTAVLVLSGVNDWEANVDAENISADLGSSNTTSCLNVGACSDFKFSARGINVKNTGHTNESVPRVVSMQDGARNFDSTFIKSKDCTGSTFLANNCVGTVDLIDALNCSDNGIYAGAGSEVYVGNFVYRGSEEALVSIGNSIVNVGTLYVTGDAGYCVNPADSKSITIGTLIVDVDQDGNSPSGLLRTRTSNNESGDMIIGSIIGKFAGERLFAFDTGTLEKLSIGSCDIEFIYDASKVGALNSFARFTACKEVHVGGMNIKVTTDNFTSSKVFELGSFSSLSRNSYINNLTCDFYKPDGTADVNGFFRGYIAVEHMRGRSGSCWRTSLGPFVKEVGTDWVDGIGTGGSPTGGYWYKGADLVLGSKTTAPFRTRCVASGTPGTWVDY